jgi:hypothetical protein
MSLFGEGRIAKAIQGEVVHLHVTLLNPSKEGSFLIKYI